MNRCKLQKDIMQNFWLQKNSYLAAKSYIATQGSGFKHHNLSDISISIVYKSKAKLCKYVRIFVIEAWLVFLLTAEKHLLPSLAHLSGFQEQKSFLSFLFSRQFLGLAEHLGTVGIFKSPRTVNDVIFWHLLPRQ